MCCQPIMERHLEYNINWGRVHNKLLLFEIQSKFGGGGEGATQDPNSQYLPTKCRKSPKYLVLPNQIKELQIANSWSLGPCKKKHFPNLKNTKSCQHSEVKLFALDPSIATLDILILYRTNQQKFKAYIKERCIQRADFDLKFYGHEIVTL